MGGRKGGMATLEQDGNAESAVEDQPVAEKEARASPEVGNKKKKKKKKKGNDGAGNGRANGDSFSHSSAADTPLSELSSDERFAENVNLLRSNSADALWVKLDGVTLAEDGVLELCAALRKNTVTLSLNLSCCELSDDAAWLIAETLASGAASDLIDLDLRGNALSEDCNFRVLDKLKPRRSLNVETGELPQRIPISVDGASNSWASGGSRGGGRGRGRGRGGRSGEVAGDKPPVSSEVEAAPPSSGSLADAVKRSGLARRYFQVDEEDEGEGEAAESESQAPESDPQQDCLVLWDEIRALLEEPVPPLQPLADALWAATAHVQAEMDACMLPLLPSTSLEDLRPATALALAGLDAIERVLALAPASPLLASWARRPLRPVPAAGPHRVAAAELLSQLLRGGAPPVARAVGATQALRLSLQLAMERPACSGLQCAALRALGGALGHGARAVGLWEQAFQARVGQGYAQAASQAALRDAAVGEGEGRENQRSSSTGVPLPEALASLLQGAPDLLVAARSPAVGFALAAASLLRRAAAGEDVGERHEDAGEPEPGGGQALSRALEGVRGWSAFAAPGGALERLLAEQEGELGGPKPLRSMLSMGSFQPGGMSGEDLIQLLRNMQLPVGLLE